MWKWIQKWGSPKLFYQMSFSWGLGFTLVATALLSVGLIWGLVFSPADYQQGNSFRIIYIHVPAAMLAEVIYMTMASMGVISIVWKIKMASMVLRSIAPVGTVFAFLALATGAIWGKPTWGAWWVWDARITAMLILLFLYLGVIALYHVMENQQSADKSAAVLTLIGVVNIPIIKYSVEWWNTLHQPATFTLTEKPAMPPEMWIPLLMMAVGSYCFFLAQLLSRSRTEILVRERKSGWVREEIERLSGKGA